MPETAATGESSVARIAPWAVSVAAAFAALAAMTGLQDHDYFWHVTTGRLIVDEGLPRTDPFSFTYRGGDWILHEWGGEVLLHLGATVLGTAGLIVAWSLLLAAVLLVMAGGMARRGATVKGAIVALVLTGLAVVPYVALRPVMLSLVLIAGVAWLLLEIRDDRMRLALVLPPLFVVWANLHGFWAIGLGILAVFIAASWLGWTAVRAARVRLTLIGALSVVGALLTPYSLGVLLYPFRYVDSGDWGLENIVEWQSPDFHEPAHWPLLAILLTMVLLRGRGAPRWLELTAWLALAGSLYALRLTPVAAILSGFVIALAMRRGSIRAEAPVNPPRARRRSALVLDWGFAGIVVIASAVALVRSAAADSVVNPELFPVEAVDALAEQDPAATVVADYAWGGYVIHRLSAEGGTVFVDGRNDMYPQSILEDYTAIRDAKPEATELLDAYGATAILMRPDTALVQRTTELRGWCRAYADDVAVLLLRGSCEPVSGLRQDLVDPDRVGLERGFLGKPVGSVPLVVHGAAAVP